MGVRCQKATNSKIVVSISWETMVDMLLRIHRCFPFVIFPQRLNMNTSSCCATTKLISDAIVILRDEPNTVAYCSWRFQLSLGFMAMQRLIIKNRSTSIMVAMLTKREASFLPNTSPIMSVVRNRTGTKKMPTDTRTPRIVVIFVPNVLTMTIAATNRAKRKSRF